MEGTRLTLTSVACWMLCHWGCRNFNSYFKPTNTNRLMRVSNSALRTPQLQRLLGSAFLTIRVQNYWSSQSPFLPEDSKSHQNKSICRRMYSNWREGRIKQNSFGTNILIRLIQAFSSWLCGIGQRGSALVADIALQTSRLTRGTPGNAHSCWKPRCLFKCLAIISFESWLYSCTSLHFLCFCPFWIFSHYLANNV